MIPVRVVTWCLIALSAVCAFGQQQPVAVDDQKPAGHVLGIIPNYRTYPELGQYKPVGAKAKFGIAAEDTFDRGTFVLAGALAGLNQLDRSDRGFGEGAGGYAHYYVTSYADLAIGNYMTEAVYPSLLHQDPRYFRRGSGSTWSRLGFAVGQIFRTRTDSGGHQFNYSEFVGNSTAVAISTAYYPADRNVSDAVSQLGIQIALDMAGNVIKEFWPNRDGKASQRASRH
jgi:hypothetical protein